MDLDILDPMVQSKIPTEHPTKKEYLTSFWLILAWRTEGVKMQLNVPINRRRVILENFWYFRAEYAIKCSFRARLAKFL